ncbi:MAG TPA: hypothetical protein VGC57_03210 [Cellulomonas sp.]
MTPRDLVQPQHAVRATTVLLLLSLLPLLRATLRGPFRPPV